MGKVVTLIQSDIQINAYTTHGPFATDVLANHYAEHILGWPKDSWRIFNIKDPAYTKGEARWDALTDDFGEVVALYECSGCHRWFHPGDTFVTGDGDEYCYADQTGNGCILRFASEEQQSAAGIVI